MEIPVAPITDDREHMIMRAICDERISLPLEAFKGHPEIYDQIVAILPADQLMDVKVAWRCNTTQYWHAEVDAAAAGPLYAKLGYSAAAIEAMNLNPFRGHVNLTAQGAKLLGEEPAHSGHPNPGARQSGHSPAPFITIEGDDGQDYEVLQMVLDEPPERLYNRWVKDRIEFYKRLEPTAPLRDVPLKVDPNPVHRLRLSISNGLGQVSDAIWNIVLANPEKAGLEGIHNVADKHIGYWVHQGWPPPFCLLLFLHWGSWILPVARWCFCNKGDQDVSS